MIVILDQIQIAEGELDFTYARSSGPGGQNVNKVNTKAVLRWNFHRSMSLPQQERARMYRELEARLTSEGDLVISSDRFRDQIRNRQDCLEKFRRIIENALRKPLPRKKTKPSFTSKLRALEKKRKHSEKKRHRKRARDLD